MNTSLLLDKKYRWENNTDNEWQKRFVPLLLQESNIYIKRGRIQELPKLVSSKTQKKIRLCVRINNRNILVLWKLLRAKNKEKDTPQVKLFVRYVDDIVRTVRGEPSSVLDAASSLHPNLQFTL